ncbi:carboxymuconolactone decarboxylase family protein [Alcanivorax sp. 1008]|uniref:carboxymuconolactone decarboxylase family protein n=1 Tax=Alcanivorax sp. 1008 TaxID=2816853 RepID=UPI001DF3C4FD|nr:carboxymuconolactone decarboxylase family protein [Alcanivorax sp. 1008]MCC1496655.1 carboxymuconolactone decarboxylase family protein [Alcanivorax sp. 1008]
MSDIQAAVFRKRTFTLPLLGRSLAAAGITMPILIHALIRPSLSPALREEIMLAVTSVNDCRYCSWVHTGLALENGVDMDSLNALLGRDLGSDPGSVEEREAVAILFGKHFADSVRHPSKVARDKLQQHFNAGERREIMAYIHAIYFANLTGNSADAVLARLRGQKTEGNLLVELIAALLGAPVLGAIWLNSRRSGKPVMAEL